MTAPHDHQWEPDTTLDGWRCEDEMCAAQPVAPSPDAPGLTLTSVQTPHTCGYCHGIHDPAEGAVRASAEAARAALAAQSEETPRPDSAQTDWGETRRAR